jgi:hypothetical protein
MCPLTISVRAFIFLLFLLMISIKLLHFPIVFFLQMTILSGNKTPHDCSLLQLDIDFMYWQCTSNYMDSNFGKTMVISFIIKTNITRFAYRLCEFRINRKGTTKDLGIILDAKLYCRSNVDCIFSQALNLLGLSRVTTFPSHPYAAFSSCISQ